MTYDWAMADELPRFLRIARAVALISSTTACGGAATEVAPKAPTTTEKPAPKEAAEDDEKPTVVQGDPTVGSGPCRCSWDSNTAAATRVCKKNEVAYTGGLCVPGSRPKYPIAIGPLPPPDLSA